MVHILSFHHVILLLGFLERRRQFFVFSLFTLAALSIIAFSPGKCNPLIRLCVFCGGFCGTRKRRKRNVFYL